jgi:hypothetical protein
VQAIVTRRLELRLLALKEVPAFVAYRRDPGCGRSAPAAPALPRADMRR